MATDGGAVRADEHATAGDWTRDWGRLLRTARQVAGLSLTDLSARTGLSKGYLSKLEAGQDGARN
ncbi:MAG TPA: helix-turn-helix transcriptional regulator, partial [Ktedonobacterales bacterium]